MRKTQIQQTAIKIAYSFSA